MSKESFRYKVSLSYVNSDSNSEILIDSNQIQYIAIDKDFDNTNMPVIAIMGSIEKDIIDDMINNINNNIVTLGIYRYDINNQNDDITKKYFHDRFIYIISDDVSKTAELDYYEDNNNTLLYKDITIWLIQQDSINNNRHTINGIFKNVTTNSLILNTTNYLGKVLLEPIKYDNKYDQIIIPPQDSISSYISYLNNSLSVFYDTQYRFFIDFDMTYILSSSGKVVKSKNQDIFTIEINIKNIDYNTNEELGMYINKNGDKASITVNTTDIEYTKNNISNKLVNKIITIDSEGNVLEKNVDNNKIKVTGNMNRIINISNNDNNAINNIASSIEMNNVMLTIVKNDLDASIFTMNKEYIINDELHEDYKGKYLLCSTKQLFVKQTDYFIMTTVLTFKKI